MLQFRVKGSAAEPYTVRFERVGADVRAYCSCPAGRKAAQLCKHVKFAIEGRPEVVGDLSDDRGSLLELIKGTSLETRASGYVPPAERARVEGCKTVAEVYAAYRTQLEERGYTVEYGKADGDFPGERLSLFEHFKNGKPRKTPSVMLTFDELTCDHGVMPDGSMIPLNVRPREKPFGVSGKVRSGQWRDPAAALHAFLLNAGIVVV